MTALMKAIEDVRERFSVEIATTPEQVREAHHLRYQVYCVENEYLENVDGLEVDEYDIHSCQVLLRHNASGEVVGAVRLVLSLEDTPDASFPMQHVCPAALSDFVPMRTTAEISRFALSKTRRDLIGANAGLLRLALVQGLVALSAELGITHWVAVMEPTLLRLLRGSAIYFANIGTPIEYHGLRQACFAEVDSLLARVFAENGPIWGLLTDDGALWAAPKQCAMAA